MDYQEAKQKLEQAMEMHGFIPHTRKKYNAIFESFYEFSEVADVVDLTEEMALQFLKCKESGDLSSPGTLRNYSVALKFIFTYVLDRGKIHAVPKHRMLPVFKPLEGVLDIEEAKLLMIQAMELRGLSQVSQGRYLNHIEAFVTAIGKTDDLRAITIHDAKNFIYNARVSLQKSPSTCNAYTSTIKRLFLDVLQKEWQEDVIPHYKLPSKLPVILSKENVLRLIDAIANPMHRMAVILMYSAGLRVSEAVALRLCDIKRDTMQIVVEQGKGAKDRRAILSDACLRELENYWRNHRPTNYFFPSLRFGKAFVSKGAIQAAVSIAARKLGFENVSCHTLRHCFATHLIENNEDVFTVKDALGHQHLKTTVKYVHLASISGLNVKSPYDL